MSHRGVTLLELLIVIALLLGAAGLVLPALGNQLAERSFTSTMEQIEAHLLLARAEAMASGRALEVRWNPATSEVIVIEFDPEAEAAGSVEGSSFSPQQDAEFDSRGFNSEALDDLIPLTDLGDDESKAQPILSLRVPGEFQLSRRPAQLAEQASPDETESIDRFLSSDELESDQRPMRLAVYVGDGSALLARTLWLIDESDEMRMARLDINPWTGVPRVQRVKPSAMSEGNSNDDEAIAQEDFAIDEEGGAG